MSIGEKIWRGTAWTSGANLLARVGTFLGNLAIIQLLGLDQVGQLGLIESWLTLITMFSVLGLNLAATKYVSHYLEADKQAIGNISTIVLVLGAFNGLIICGGTFAILKLLPANLLSPTSIWAPIQTTLSNSISIIMGLILVMTLRHIMAGVIYGLQAFHTFVTANIIIGLISYPISYVLASYYGLNGALTVRLILLTVEFLVLGFVFWRTIHHMDIKLSLANFRAHTKQLVNFGTPALLGQLIANPVQTFMVSYLASQTNGLAQIGLLTVAKRLVTLTAFIPGAIATTIMPILSTEWEKGDQKTFRKDILSILRMLWFSSLPITIFFLASTATLLGFLYGEEYVAAAGIASIFLIVQLVSSINETGDKILAATNRMWLSTGNNFIWAALFLGTGMLLVPWGYALGYALAFLVSFVLYAMLQIWCLHYLYKLQLRSLLSPLGLSLFLIGLTSLSAYFLAPPWQLINAGLLASIVVLVIWYNFLDLDERKSITHRLIRINLINIVWQKWQAYKQI